MDMLLFSLKIFSQWRELYAFADIEMATIFPYGYAVFK